MKQPLVIEIYADNGEFSHYALIDIDTGEKLWSENPDECRAKGNPVEKLEAIRKDAFGQGHASGWQKSKMKSKESWNDSYKKYLKNL